MGIKIESKFNALSQVQTPGAGARLARRVTAVLLFGIVVLFLPWTQNITSSGQLTSLNQSGRPQVINSAIAGKIEKWFVIEGQKVNKGDTILQISEIKDYFLNPALISRTREQIENKERAISSTESKTQALERQIKALEAGLKFSIEKTKNKVKQSRLKVQSDSTDVVAAKIDWDIAQKQYERQKELYDKGLKSLTELEQRKLKLQESQAKMISVENKYMASQQELINAEIELNSQYAEYTDKISKAESELNSTFGYLYDAEASLAKLRNEYSNLVIRNQFYFITAPQDGYIVKASKEGIGEIVKEGDEVISIIATDNQPAVELFVKPIDLPLIQIGDKVRIQFEGWPALVFTGWPGASFGTFGGVIRVIDRNISLNGKFRILVVPDTKDHVWPEQVKMGSGAYGWALLKDVPVWYELWRNMNGFPPDFRDELIGTDKAKKEK